MDNFMMQLADKINAQNMIRANTSAEVEELGHIKGQIEALQATVDQAKEMMERLTEITQQNMALAEEAAKKTANEVTNEATDEATKEATKEAINEASKESLRESEQPKLDEDILYIIEEEVSQLSKKMEEIKSSLQEERDQQLSECSAVSANEGISLGLEDIKGRLTALEKMTSEVSDQVTRSVQAALGQDDQADFDAFDEEEAIDQLRELMDQLREEYAAQKLELLEKQTQNQKQMQETMEQLLEKSDSERVEQIRMCELVERLREECGSQKEEQGRLYEELSRFMKEQEQKDGSLDQAELFNDMKLELSRLDEHLTNIGANATTKNAENTNSLRHFLQENFDKLQEASKKNGEETEDGEEFRKLLEEFIAKQPERDAKLEDRLTKMHEGLREGYHKECVKVYRNVQAAFSEENQRQTAMLEEKMGKASGSAKVAMIFSILAFLMSLAGVVLQVLKML